MATATGPPRDGHGLYFALLAGVAYACAVPLFFRALKHGRLSLVTPIVAADGTIASLFAILTGDPVAAATVFAIGLLGAGVFLIAVVSEPGLPDGGPHDWNARRTVVNALVASCFFGTALFASGSAVELGAPWVISLTRTTAAIASLAMVIRIGVPRSLELFLWAGLVGALDVAGAFAYLEAAAIDLPLAAVMASQAAGFGVVSGIVFMNERLERHQVVGVALILLGIVWAALT